MKIFAVLILAVALSGCAARGPYHAAVVVEHDSVTIVKAFQQAEVDEFNAGRESLAEHQNLEALIEKVALGGQAVTLALQAGAAQSDVLAKVGVLVQAVSDLNTKGVLGIKNPTSKQVLTTALNAIKALLTNLQNEVGASHSVQGCAWGEMFDPKCTVLTGGR